MTAKRELATSRWQRRAFVLSVSLAGASCGAPQTWTAPPLRDGSAVHQTAAATAAASDLAPPPADLVAAFSLSPLYTKHLMVGGFPILGSRTAADGGLREAAYLVERLIGHRPDILDALARRRVRFVVMATTERTTDVPEHADLVPKEYWDRRARGLGATAARPAVSCGEENLLDLEGDPYAAENILVHELSHAIHEMALADLDPSFDMRLQQAYEAARVAGRWSRTYAMENHREYWAEGAQSWFDTNRRNDDVHGPIATRADLIHYDPPLAALLAEVFGNEPWRYRKPRDRDAAETRHLAGFDRARAPRFDWATTSPALPPNADLPTVALERGPISRSPSSTVATHLEVQNHRRSSVIVEWIDFEGRPVLYATVGPGERHGLSTYVGHAWRISEGTNVLGFVAAPASASRVDVR